MVNTYKSSGDKLLEEDIINNAHYKCLFKNNHAVMLLLDPDTGGIIDANPAACSFYGYSHEDLLKMKISSLNIMDEEKLFMEIEAAKNENRNLFFFKHRLSNGEIRDVEVYSGPISLKKKQLLYSIIHDISERRKAEEELKESNSALQREIKERKRIENELANRNHIMTAILGNLSFGVAMVESDTGRIMFVNESAEKLLGRKIPQDGRIQGMAEDYKLFRFGTGTLYPQDEMPLVKGLYGERSYVNDMVVARPDGKKVVLEVNGAPVKDISGKIIASLISFNDITERMHTENKIKLLNARLTEANQLLEATNAELQEAVAVSEEEAAEYKKITDTFSKVKAAAENENIEKGNLLENISLEIKRQVTDFIGQTDMASLEDLGNVQEKYANHVKKSAEFLLKIISDALNSVKIEEGK